MTRAYVADGLAEVEKHLRLPPGNDESVKDWLTIRVMSFLAWTSRHQIEIAKLKDVSLPDLEKIIHRWQRDEKVFPAR